MEILAYIIIAIWLIWVLWSFVLWKKDVGHFREKSIFKNQHPWRDHLIESILGGLILFVPPILIFFVLQYFGLSEEWSYVVLCISLVVWIYFIDKYKIAKRRIK